MAASLLRPLRLLVSVAALACTLGGFAPAPASAAQTAGVQAHLLWSRYDAADRERMLDRAKEAGAGIVRVDVGWASMELDGKGDYNGWYLGKVDHVVAEAEERGIKVLFTFWETPCWASSAPESLKQGCEGQWWDRGVQRYPPNDAADFADAFAFMVRRYGDRVAAWELWNEPNHTEYLRGADPVGEYAKMVRAAYPAAKAADARVPVIAGSLADSDFEFTQALLDRGVGGHFDAWSVHPYSEDRSPLHPGIPGWTKKSFAAGVPAVRDTLLRAGEDKPIWLTEFGWSTCDVRGGRAYENCVDANTQATWLRQAFEHMRNWSYVPVGITFNLEDTSGDTGDRVDNYGLLRVDGAAKPAFAAFRSAAEGLAAGAPPPPPASSPGDPGSSGGSGGPGPAGSPAAGGSPAPSRGAPARRRTGPRSVTLRVFRQRRGARIEGHLPVGRTLRVRAYRWKPRERRFSRNTSYRALITVRPGGAFRYRLVSPALARGRWLIVVKGRRVPLLQASAVLGRRAA